MVWCAWFEYNAIKKWWQFFTIGRVDVWVQKVVSLPLRSFTPSSISVKHFSWEYIGSNTSSPQPLPSHLGFPSGSVAKNPSARLETQETWVRSLGQGDPLEERMATHASILAWRIPWTEESDRLQSVESQTDRHDWNNWAYLCHVKPLLFLGLWWLAVGSVHTQSF